MVSHGYGSAGPYVNTTGRNDIVAAKVSLNDGVLHLFVRTKQPLTSRSDPNWMLLYLDVDQNASTGWLGYDFVLNRQPAGAETATLERNQGGYTWGGGLDVVYRCADCEMELAIPIADLHLSSVPKGIDFKWADNTQQTGEASDFTLNGDVAPNDRFNYRAKTGS